MATRYAALRIEARLLGPMGPKEVEQIAWQEIAEWVPTNWRTSLPYPNPLEIDADPCVEFTIPFRSKKELMRGINGLAASLHRDYVDPLSLTIEAFLVEANVAGKTIIPSAPMAEALMVAGFWTNTNWQNTPPLYPPRASRVPTEVFTQGWAQ